MACSCSGVVAVFSPTRKEYPWSNCRSENGLRDRATRKSAGGTLGDEAYTMLTRDFYL